MHEPHFHFPRQNKSEKNGGLATVVAVALIILAWFLATHTHLCHGQTPPIAVSGGSTLGVTTSDSATWKQFIVQGPSPASSLTPQAYSVLWAESDGTSGGIFQGTLSFSGTPLASNSPLPAPSPASDLPVGTLTTAISAAIAGIPAADTQSMARGYEALASQIDSGTIVSPLQLQLATGTHLLATFNSTQLESFKAFTAAVNGWVDARQCEGKLAPDKMAKYSETYHAVAAACGGYKMAAVNSHRMERTAGTASKPGSPPAAKVDCAHTAPSTAHEREQLPPQSPCANGHCPMQEPQPQRRRLINR